MTTDAPAARLDTPRAPRPLWRRVKPKSLVHLLGIVMIAALVYPLIMLLVRASGDARASWDAIAAIPDLWPSLLNTVWLALGCVVIAVVVGVLLALCVANLPRRWYNTAQLLCILPLFMPPIAAVSGWVFVASSAVGYGNVLLRKVLGIEGDDGPFNVYSLPWIVFSTALYLISYVFLFVSTALRESDATLELSARVFGSSWFMTQIRVVLPSIRPALYYAIGIAMLLGLGQFTAPLLLGATARVNVITTEMYRLTSASPPNYDAATLLSVPLLAVAMIIVAVQRRSLGNLRRYTSVSRGAMRARNPRRWLIVPPIIYVVLAIVPPTASLILVSLSPYWTGSVDFSNMSLRSYREVLSTPQYVDSITTTVQVVILSVIGGIILSTAVALYITRSRSFVARLLEFTINLPIAMPGIVIGLGILISYGLGFLDLYGSQAVFVIAYIYLYMIFGTRMIISGLTRLPDSYDHAARVAGAGAMSTFLRIKLPLLRNSMTSAGMLMLVLMSHEFAASMILRTSFLQVLSTKLFDAFNYGIYPDVAALAVIMVAISAICAVVILSTRGGRNLEL
ncbi:iron ABC transporter permease [Dactylosporangium sp. NPDC051485]|uniref:ABC transporter permease n=1 Tax=Dactylosporangium sp. NPDC051485 TaxID=3154846 RepID=UPI0034356A94